MGAASRLLAVRLPTLAAVGLLFCASAGGDVFHLRGGGQIEGELINRDGGLVRIQTPHAQVTLSADDVVRVEQHPHARQIKLYEELAGKIPKTADGHYQLGLWCLEHGLAAQAREEFNKALRCDAQHADTRQALGHVRIGQAWLEPSPASGSESAAAQPDSRGPQRPRPAGAPPATQAAAAGGAGRAIELARASLHDAEREMMQTLRAEWQRRIRTIQTNYLAGASKKQFNQGADLLLAIRDPLAVEPMLAVLGDGPADQRKLLMTALGQFQTSAATMGLLEAAVLDDDQDVRKAALNQLLNRDDGRITAFLLKSLASEDYDVMANAAAALGRLRVISAIPALVKELTARETRRVSTDSVVRTMRQTFIDEAGRLRSVYINRNYSDPFHTRKITVTVYRTEVQEALIAITGENFGFDAEAWMDWYRRNGGQPGGNNK